MKILEVNTEKTWRGGERQTFYNIKGFINAGEQVSLLCRKDFELSRKAQALGITIHQVQSSLRSIIFLASSGSKFDVIHVQTAKSQFHAVLTKPFHQRPVVYTRRVDFVPKGRLTKMKYLLTDKIIAISNAIRDILNDFGLKDIAVISDVTEIKNLDKARAKNFIDKNKWSEKKIVATTAAFVQHKDPLTMVKTIHELSKLRNDFVFLHFGDGVLKPEVEKSIAQFQLFDYYKLMGFMDEVEDFFSVIDVFAMSSEEEGLGSSVLDSFIYKVPVASTDAGGLKEIVAGNGLLSPVRDYKSLAANINRLLSDNAIKTELAEKAHKYVLINHSLTKIAEEYIAVFNTLISK